jgi:hypothetical protein
MWWTQFRSKILLAIGCILVLGIIALILGVYFKSLSK